MTSWYKICDWYPLIFNTVYYVACLDPDCTEKSPTRNPQSAKASSHRAALEHGCSIYFQVLITGPLWQQQQQQRHLSLPTKEWIEALFWESSLPLSTAFLSSFEAKVASDCGGADKHLCCRQAPPLQLHLSHCALLDLLQDPIYLTTTLPRWDNRSQCFPGDWNHWSSSSWFVFSVSAAILA